MTFEERFDWRLFFIMLALFTISCVAIYSAIQTNQYSDNYVLRQIMWYILGSFIIAGMMMIEPIQYKGLSWYVYGAGMLVLLALVVAPASIAPVINGQKSWFLLPGIGSIQPSEFMKIFTILVLSRVIVNHNKENQFKTTKTDFVLLMKIMGVTFAPIMLIMQQPDFGTALVYLGIMSGLIIVAGVTWKLILPIYGLIGAVGGTVFYLVIQAPDVLRKYLGIQEYQFGRIYAWLEPYKYQSGEGYHLIKSLQAIGSGMLTGKGFGGGEVYIPESHTDFIFSVIGEEFGFVGACLVILVFFLLIYHLIQLAIRANYSYSAYVCVGVVSMITFHVFQNIGMTVQLLPITGIPLPFISYGGSSLLANLMAIGLAFAVHYHQREFMFGDNNLQD
ncbi:rod shape-determining protein RodA [Thalassobacillus devorans]|uniref:Rod shape-determining protein RodA n=1 Tax=Thalassobacillus devorans TaxID=279813 RepID=A0ABQ1PRB0_9BACI|nr:FtsW/RodA/SpoVE family cell cycle protein [Thalassobacillus devorans]NIK30591.1 rod shape determining protein RodA [Thalassobacillus devorans]GGD01698.1 rod shape-determining protein RodA [Thalassobacillus devorans]